MIIPPVVANYARLEPHDRKKNFQHLSHLVIIPPVSVANYARLEPHDRKKNVQHFSHFLVLTANNVYLIKI